MLDAGIGHGPVDFEGIQLRTIVGGKPLDGLWAGLLWPKLKSTTKPGPSIPKSYGGVSGGALWELHVELDKDLKTAKVNKRLHGVTFRRSEDYKRLTFNAALSIESIVKTVA